MNAIFSIVIFTVIGTVSIGLMQKNKTSALRQQINTQKTNGFYQNELLAWHAQFASCPTSQQDSRGWCHRPNNANEKFRKDTTGSSCGGNAGASTGMKLCIGNR